MDPDPWLGRRSELAESWNLIVKRMSVVPRVLDVAAGRRLISQGQIPDQIYRLHTGLIKLLHRAEGAEETVVGLLEEGWPLGTIAVALGLPSHVSAVTTTDAVLTAIPAILIRRAIAQDVILSNALLRINSLKVVDQLDRFALMTLQPARRRLEHLLRQLATRSGRVAENGVIRIDLPMPQYELASIVNMTPETLSRSMAELERHGVIRRRTSRTLYVTRERSRSGDRRHSTSVRGVAAQAWEPRSGAP